MLILGEPLFVWIGIAALVSICATAFFGMKRKHKLHVRFAITSVALAFGHLLVKLITE